MVLFKKLIVLTLFTFLFNSPEASAQAHYKNGLGIRMSSLTSLDFKHFLNEERALEFMIGTHYRWYGIGGSALYEIHNYVKKRTVRGVDWWYGGGITSGYWDNFDDQGFVGGYEGFYFGISATAGLEFTPPEAPMVNIFLDYKPTLRLIGPEHYWGEGSFGIRYVWN